MRYVHNIYLFGSTIEVIIYIHMRRKDHLFQRVPKSTDYKTQTHNSNELIGCKTRSVDHST